jgi:hypothetical protein
MHLRIRTTKGDFFWSSVISGALIGPGLFVSILAWGIPTVFTVERVWKWDLGFAGKAIAVPLVALSWGTAVACLNCVINGMRTLRIRKDAWPRDHTLSLRENGLTIETTGTTTFRRYSDMEGMKTWCGLWFVLDTGGIMVMFRPALVLEGDAAEFAQALDERRGPGCSEGRSTLFF